MLRENDFINEENFYLAYKRLQTVSFDYYKELYKPDLINFGLDLKENIRYSISKIKSGSYVTNKVHKLFLPKPNGLIRPITVLDFQDLLIYQALINVVAEAFHSDFQKYYNNSLFGNVYNKTSNKNQKIFFYVKWQTQWEKFLNQTKNLYDQGFVYLSEFDMASFYDTIDHRVLSEFLGDKLEPKLIEFLMKLLSDWTVDGERLNKRIGHGIPQGPLASGFLSEIYLKYIDNEIIENIDGNSIKYIRYADDIRLFSKDSTTGKRHLVYLDLFARDIGLIPQTGKISTKKIESAEELTKHIESTSGIYPSSYESKSVASKSGQISRLANSFEFNGNFNEIETEELLKEIIETLEGNKPDKTLLRFALYRIGPSSLLRDKLIDNYEKLLFIFEDVCIYLSKYFLYSPEVKKWVYSILDDRYIVYHYPIALLFKYFIEIIDYSNNLFKRFFESERSKQWYIKYFMLDWIKLQNPSKISSIELKNHYQLQKKLLKIKYEIASTKEEKLEHLRAMLSHKEDSIALQGLFIYINNNSSDYWLEDLLDKFISVNRFVYPLLARIENEYNRIDTFLKDLGVIPLKNGFFQEKYWEPLELKKLAKLITLVNSLKDLDVNFWVYCLDLCNSFIVTQYYKLGFNNSYSNMINKGFSEQEVFEEILHDRAFRVKFPLVAHNFLWIHSKKTEIEVESSKVSFYEVDAILKKEQNAIRQLDYKVTEMHEELIK
jgi:Reverse transcriptase (RNA-dependent DNA polymerase)